MNVGRVTRENLKSKWGLTWILKVRVLFSLYEVWKTLEDRDKYERSFQGYE